MSMLRGPFGIIALSAHRPSIPLPAKADASVTARCRPRQHSSGKSGLLDDSPMRPFHTPTRREAARRSRACSLRDGRPEIFFAVCPMFDPSDR